MLTSEIQIKTNNVVAVQGRTILLLLFCHCLIAGVAVISTTELFPILCACLFSFLLLLTIPYNLHLLETALDRLAHGLSIEPLSLRLCWPLKRLFVLVNMLSQQTNQRVQAEQRNIAYRDQLLQQVSKTAAQEERNRLARDLHDSIKQQLFSIVVSIAAIKVRWEHNPISARKVVDEIERTALEAQVEMQALLQQLRPTALENVGLLESLRMQCQALGYRTGAEVTAELDHLPPDELLPIGAQEMIFRIVQEGFANIARHARAAHVWLSLKRQNDTLLIEIGDDGQGFDLAKQHEGPNVHGGMGLANVRERVQVLGGSITIWSMSNKGTTLHVCIPLVVASEPASEELINQQTTAAIHKAHSVLRAGVWLAELAAAFILFYTPSAIAIWAVGLCISSGIVAWLWAQQYRFQISIDLGKKHGQYIRMLAHNYGLCASILLICLLYPNYFIDWLNYRNNQWLWIIPLLFAFLLLAIIIIYLRALQNDERYYKTLAYGDLREYVQCRTQQITIDWLAYIVIASVIALHFYLFPDSVQHQQVTYMGSILLLVWLLIIIVKSIHVARWQHILSRLSKQIMQDKKGDN